MHSEWTRIEGLGLRITIGITFNQMNNVEKVKYKVFSFRLHEGTKKKLIEKQKRSGLSWNKFINELLKK